MKTRLAIVIAVALFLLGACGSDDKQNDEAAVTTTTSTTAAPLEGPQAYVDSGNYVTGLHMAKITKFDRTTRVVTYDVVQFLTGDAAKQAYTEDIGEAPDTDYYIRNQSKETRTVTLSDDAAFRVNNLGGFPPSDPDKGTEVDFDTFAAYFDAEQAFDSFFWISLEDGVATHVEEQYIP